MNIRRLLPDSVLRVLLASAVLGGALTLRADEAWQTIFDGRTLSGWKASEHPGSIAVVDGTILCNGPRAHLFYLGADGRAEFENFELELEVKADPGANSGVYFHATWQDEGWPRLAGTEVQVNNTQPPFEKNYVENKKTGSLYGFRNLYKAMARDGEWFTMNLQVRKPRVQVRLNGRLMIDYVEPVNVPVLVPGATRDQLTKGTFALQCHDEKSRVHFRNIRVRRLTDGMDANVPRPTYTEQDGQRVVLARDNFPLVNLQTHLTAGLALDQIQAIRNQTGLFAGVVVAGGAERAIHDDATARAAVAAMKDEPAFLGLQVQGSEWMKLFSPEARAAFDYILADSVAAAEQAAPGAEVQAFMDKIVADAEQTIGYTPIDVYANVTYLPAALTTRADELWTEERMVRIIAAAVTKNVALEINPRLRIPSEKFVKLAKGAGARFTIGTGDATAAEYNDWSYVLELQQKLKLGWRDFYVPGHAPTRAQRELIRN